MADINVHYSCGCGFGTIDAEEAVKHCDTHKHTISVYGVLRAPKRSKASPKQQPPTEQQSVEQVATSFSELRARLGR